jgi:hypothetical protein
LPPEPLTAHRIGLLLAAQRRWVVLAMLLSLHAALVIEPGDDFQRLWLLVHFGFFLLWQPFFAADRELDIAAVVVLLAIVIAMVWFVSGWMVVMWLVTLMGIFGGRVFTLQAENRNRFYLVGFAYLTTVLLLWAVPVFILGEQEVPDAVAEFATRFLPLLLVFLVVLPFPKEEGAGQVFDFFYAVLVFQLGVVLVLGSIVLMRYLDDDYVKSVAATVMAFGGLLLLFAILWNPRHGFSGLRTYLSSYLMSVGMPFELWMRRVAERAETESDPRRFLEESLREISAFPWMRGGTWRSPDGDGTFGSEGGHATRFYYGGLEVVFHTEMRLSPALFLHMRLLAQVVGEFYEGKRREAALRRNAYLQAVHETGARLTHDVKNLLQSLLTLTSMAPREPAEGYDGLLQRQLPLLTRRLQATLEKLRSPEVAARELTVGAVDWWTNVERRLADSGVALHGRVELERQVPSTLFDGFLENALENARAKREREPDIGIRVDFTCAEGEVKLAVCDTGSIVPADLAARLFESPVERGNAMGIGLYQVARHALQAGYRATLASNEPGRVCFELEQLAPGSAAG